MYIIHIFNYKYFQMIIIISSINTLLKIHNTILRYLVYSTKAILIPGLLANETKSHLRQGINCITPQSDLLFSFIIS